MHQLSACHATVCFDVRIDTFEVYACVFSPNAEWFKCCHGSVTHFHPFYLLVYLPTIIHILKIKRILHTSIFTYCASLHLV